MMPLSVLFPLTKHPVPGISAVNRSTDRTPHLERTGSVQTSQHRQRPFHKGVGHAASRLYARRVDSPIVTPVIQLGRDGEDVMDLYSYLLRNRIIFLGGFIDFDMTTKVVGSILALEALDKNEDIKIYINSPGGSIYTVLGVVDVMKACRADISTVAFGTTVGNASLILAAGTKGKRYAMPNSRIVLHQPAGYLRGSAIEVSITATELDRSLQVLTNMLSNFTGQSVEQMEMETNRRNFLSPEEACKLGLIDGIV